jgi:MscS family membrane protein
VNLTRLPWILCATVALAAVPLVATVAAERQSQQPATTQTSRDSPRTAMRGYLTACRDGAYGLAADYLAFEHGSESDRSRAARDLKRLLDQNLWVDLDALSDEPSGDLGDGDPRRDLVGSIQTAEGELPVLLERSGSDGSWRIAADTVAGADNRSRSSDLSALVDFLPEWASIRIWELELWQWSGLLISVVLAYVLALLGVNTAVRIALRLARRSNSTLDDDLVRIATAPLVAAAAVSLFAASTLPLGLPVPARAFIANAVQVSTVVALAWLAARAIDVASRAMEQRMAGRADTTLLTVIPVGRRVAKVFVMVIAALAVLQNLGINVLSILAGLGIAGIAVALAAQKTFENFFGTLSILIDQPVRRGDFCRFGEKLGTVEDIGLRSTRIRTLDRTLITVPNADFSAFQIENFGSRDRIRLFTMLGLRYETTADQLRYVLIGLKELLVSHPRVTPDPARVRFVGLGTHSLDLEVFAYIDTPDWNEYLAIQEDLLLRIMQVVEQSGTGFAFPSQTLYVGPDTGLDPERTQIAEAEVRRWRETSELPLPDLPRQRIEKLRGSLAYPAQSSASNSTPA